MSHRPALIVLAAIATAALVLAATSLGAVGSVLLVSGPNGETEAGFPSEQVNPAISGDGRFIAFVGSVGETGNGLYLRDMNGGIAEVDVPHGHSEHGIGFAAGSPSFSSSGRYLAFASEDPDVSDEDRDSSTTPAGDTFPVRDIFVYDRSSGRVSLVSRANGAKGAGGNEDSNLPSISADGNYVAFQTEATDFLHGSYGGIFVRDLRRHTTTPVASLRLHPGGALNGGFTPSISAHGRWVAFLTTTHFRHGNALEVAVRDMKSKRAVYASRADGRRGALAAADCKLPAISADGRYVAFASKAKNLSRIDRDSVEDVFVRDLKTNRTMLVSRAQGRHGAAGSGDSSSPSISADGRYVAFDSRGSNLVPADTLHATSVFRYQLLP